MTPSPIVINTAPMTMASVVELCLATVVAVVSVVGLLPVAGEDGVLVLFVAPVLALVELLLLLFDVVELLELLVCVLVFDFDDVLVFEDLAVVGVPLYEPPPYALFPYEFVLANAGAMVSMLAIPAIARMEYNVLDSTMCSLCASREIVCRIICLCYHEIN